MNKIIKVLISALAVFILAYVLPGVGVSSYFTAIIVAIVLSILNLLIRPILVIFTLPITVLTLGLFMFVINAIIILLTDKLIEGFSVSSIWMAMLFSILLSVLQSFLHSILSPKKK